MSDARSGTIATDSAGIKAGQEQYLFPCAAPYYEDPIVIAGAKGVTVVDADGREYLDCFSGILTTALGHCHPEVVERIQEQLETLGHTSTLYITENQVEMARRLARIAPGALNKTFFSNSGTEAVETAVMAARMYTGRNDVIALRYGYSGRSTLATNLTAHASWRPLDSSVAGIKHVMAPYPYRAPIGAATDEELVDFYLRDLEEVIETTTDGKPAAFIAETILGVGGCIVPPVGYFQRAVELIRSYGALFICDEVQAGFGRTGTRWFGIEHWDVTPDIMVMAKGLANGWPVAATITTDEIAASWRAKTISTFGGNPVGMAAAGATLEILERERAPENAAARGAQLRTGLEQLQRRHAWIGEVRGMGLMMGLELVQDRDSKRPSPAKTVALLQAAKAEGLLLGAGGLHGQVIRIGPSLLVTEAEIAEGLERLARACDAVAS